LRIEDSVKMPYTKKQLEGNIEIEKDYFNSGKKFEGSISIKCPRCGNRLIRSKGRHLLCICGRVYAKMDRRFKEIRKDEDRFMYDYINQLEE
jgi:tRNA(Ile2) C34 agmatinyltransferase TiaS